MGKVISRLNKQYYRFNAENRAHREISREKPVMAPRHPTTENVLKALLEENKHVKEQGMLKDPALDEYLKKVYVKSHDPIAEKKKKPSERSQLPLDRTSPQESQLGYYEPHIIPKGKMTLLQAMQFLADNQGNPEVFNISKISSEYNLAENDVESILQYFSSYKVYIKDDKEKGKDENKILKHFGALNKPVMLQDSNNSVQQKSES